MREPTVELPLHPYWAMRRPQPPDYFPTVAGESDLNRIPVVPGAIVAFLGVRANELS